MPYVGSWLVAFALTCAIEVPIAAYALRVFRRNVVERALLCFFANLATHPCVWFVFPELLHGPVYYVGAESFAFAAEALFFFLAFPRVTLLRAAAVSAIANGASFAIGLLLSPWLFGG